MGQLDRAREVLDRLLDQPPLSMYHGMARVDAGLVVSTLDPKRTLLELVQPGLIPLHVEAERAVSRRLGASCYSPVAAWARHEDGVLKVEATVVSPDGSLVLNKGFNGFDCCLLRLSKDCYIFNVSP